MAAPNGNGNRANVRDHRMLLAEADEITGTAKIIASLAEEVTAGTEVQIRSLDSALSGVNELSTSLKETATQADSAAARARRPHDRRNGPADHRREGLAGQEHDRGLGRRRERDVHVLDERLRRVGGARRIDRERCGDATPRRRRARDVHRCGPVRRHPGRPRDRHRELAGRRPVDHPSLSDLGF